MYRLVSRVEHLHQALRVLIFMQCFALIAVGCAKATESNWSLATIQGSAELRCVIVSPDGLVAATGNKQGEVEIWDLKAKKCLKKWTAHPRGVQSIAYSPGGTRLASEGQDRTIAIWDTTTFNELCRIKDPSGSEVLGEPLFQNSRIAFDVSGKKLAGFGWFWDCPSGTQLERYGTRGPVVCVGNVLASECRKGFQVLDLKKAKSLLTQKEDALQCLAISPDGKQLAFGRATYGVGAKVIELSAPFNERTIPSVKSWAFSIAYSNDSKYFAISEKKVGIAIFDSESLALIDSIASPKTNNSCISFSPDGSYLTGVGENNDLRIWARRK